MADFQAYERAKRIGTKRPIDVSLKREQELKEQFASKTQAELAKKFEADTATSIDWQPTFSRIKIKPDPEALSSLIVTSQADTLIRGTVVSVGPDVGKKDGRAVEKFYPGQRILYMRSHVMTYQGADGIAHHFLKENADVSSVIAIEPRMEGSGATSNSAFMANTSVATAYSLGAIATALEEQK